MPFENEISYSFPKYLQLPYAFPTFNVLLRIVIKIQLIIY